MYVIYVSKQIITGESIYLFFSLRPSQMTLLLQVEEYCFTKFIIGAPLLHAQVRWSQEGDVVIIVAIVFKVNIVTNMNK